MSENHDNEERAAYITFTAQLLERLDLTKLKAVLNLVLSLVD